MNDQLVGNITTIVDEIFKKKEEAEMKSETEAALTSAATTITQLNESLEAKDVEHKAEVVDFQETITSLETQLSAAVESKTVLEDEKAKFDKEQNELTKRAEIAEEDLDNMKKIQLADERMEVLMAAGVASTNREIQQEKVRDMSEEDFATYKDELVSVRAFVVKELEGQSDDPDALKAAKKAEVEKAEAEKQKKVLVVRLHELKDSGTEVTEEVEIAKIQEMSDEEFASYKDELVASLDSGDTSSIDPMRAIAAALNIEATPNADVLTKYRALGAQMAENIKSRKDK